MAAAGQPGSGQIIITPASQTPSTVNLAFNGLPAVAGYTISLTPQQVNLNGSAATATVSMTPMVTVPSNAIRSNTRHSALIVLSRGNWWRLSLVTGFLAVLVAVWPSRQRRYRAASLWSAISLAALALGCGGGAGSSGGGGGGGASQPTPTTITLTTTSAKAGMNDQFTITATVTSNSPLTGTISFYDYGNQIFAGEIPPSNGQVQATNFGYVYGLGVHQFTARYSGDPKNLASRTSILTQTITGTTSVGLQGNTAGDYHYVNVTIGVQ
jgi:hypothetical protein